MAETMTDEAIEAVAQKIIAAVQGGDRRRDSRLNA